MEKMISQCSQSDKRFSDSIDLKKHKSIHPGENPFKYTKCDKRIHTGEKPFKCTKCDQLSSSALEDQCEDPHRREAVPVFIVWQEFLRIHAYIRSFYLLLICC